MKEVSCQACVIMFEALSRAGIPHERLTKGQVHTVEFLKNRRNRIDWGDFVELATRFGPLVGGPAGMEAASATAMDQFREYLVSFVGYITSSHRLYWMLERWAVHAAFSPIVTTYRQLPDKRILITGEIPEPYKECEEFFWISKGSFRMLPRLIGQPEAKVEADITPRRAVFTITPPPSLTVFARLGRLLKIIGAGKRMVEELRFQNEQLTAGYNELKEADRKLTESEGRFRGLFETAFGGMIIHDKGIIVEANPPAAGMLSYSQEDVIGKPVLDFIEASSRQSVIEKLGSDKDHNYEVTAVKKDGGQINLEIISKPYVYEGRPVRIAALRDISERKKLEEAILKIRKIESIGVLAGGIAHDFNNLLSANLLNLELARGYAAADGRVKARLTRAMQASIRAKDLTERLLTFSLGGEPVKNPSSLVGLVKESADLALAGSKVKCDWAAAKDLWATEVDEGQIMQVLNNLVVNAAEATDGAGVIKVTAENVVIKKNGRDRPAASGKYVRITVADNGRGIPLEETAKIFEPFYTTKDRGTGIGLTTASSIVHKHGGHIFADSQVGVGTSFSVYLPACAGEAPARAAAPSGALAGHGRILVCDDQEDIREALQFGLSQFGFKVDVAADGEEMIDLYHRAAKAGEPFDVVVMDLTIPGGMGGKESIRQLLETDPNAKVIASSGYSNDEVASKYTEYGFAGFIAKPYELRELAAMLKAVAENFFYEKQK